MMNLNRVGKEEIWGLGIWFVRRREKGVAVAAVVRVATGGGERRESMQFRDKASLGCVTYSTTSGRNTTITIPLLVFILKNIIYGLGFFLAENEKDRKRETASEERRHKQKTCCG